MAEERLTIGQLAAATGKNRRTIDYYTRCGLLPCARSAGGRRLYPAGAVERLRAISEYQAARLRLDEIRERLSEPTVSPMRQVEAIEADLSRISAEVARLRAGAPTAGGRELHDVAARSATQALAVAQGLMLFVSESSPFV
jgi:DNA-binding transcriptional MerR regulator